MEKSIFLMETDDVLRDNITELLELEGYSVTSLTLDEAKSTFQNYHVGLLIFNMHTLAEPVHSFIRFIKNKVDGIAVLCSDEDDPQIDEADIKIILPFGYDELLNKLSEFNSTNAVTGV